MAEPFLGEIRMFAGNFAPRNYAICDGTLMQIQQAQELFSLIGSRYGGDGRTSFALPDLSGRAAVGIGNTHHLGEKNGMESVAFTEESMPTHNHGVQENMSANLEVTTDRADLAIPTENSTFGAAWSPDFNIDLETYMLEGATEDVSLGGVHAESQLSLSSRGAMIPHQNMQPSLVINYIIAIKGTYPPRT